MCRSLCIKIPNCQCIDLNPGVVRDRSGAHGGPVPKHEHILQRDRL